MFFIFLRRKSLKLRKKLEKMKTKLFVGTLLMWLTFSVTNVHADGIGVNLQTGGIDDNTGLPYPKSPIQPPLQRVFGAGFGGTKQVVTSVNLL